MEPTLCSFSFFIMSNRVLNKVKNLKIYSHRSIICHSFLFRLCKWTCYYPFLQLFSLLLLYSRALHLPIHFSLSTFSCFELFAKIVSSQYVFLRQMWMVRLRALYVEEGRNLISYTFSIFYIVNKIILQYYSLRP